MPFGYLDFDGSNSASGGDIHDPGTNDFCLSFRYMDTATAQQYLVNKGQAGVAGWFAVQMNGPAGKCQVNIHVASNVAIVSNTAINDGVDHHIAITMDRDGNGVIYIDGNADKTTSIATQAGDMNNARNFYFGSYDTGIIRTTARLADLKILINGIWTPTQIAYQSANPGDYSASAGAITEYYDFSEQSGTTAGAGVTSPTNDLTITSSALWGQTATLFGSINGVDYSDVKSINGVTIANIRGIGGIDGSGQDAMNSFFTDEFDAQGSWSNSGSWTIESGAMKLPHNVTSAETATFTADKDWIAYCKLKTTKTADFYAEYKIGSSDEIKIAVDYDYADSVAELGTLSLYVASTGYTLATGLDTDSWIEVVIHFDDKHDCINIFTKANNQYTFLGGYNLTAITGDEAVTFATSNTGSGDRFLWVDYISICYPNLMSIGDSITAGANYFNPDPDTYVGNDPYNNCYQSYINITDDDDRNTLVVNKGVGSQTTANFISRVATDIIAHYPRLVIIQASNNDAVGNYPDTKTTETQTLIDTIKTALPNTKIVMLSTCEPNTNYGAYATYYPVMSGWNANQFLTLTSVDAYYQCNAGFGATADQEADGVHPKASGYEKIGNGLEVYLNEITW